MSSNELCSTSLDEAVANFGGPNTIERSGRVDAPLNEERHHIPGWWITHVVEPIRKPTKCRDQRIHHNLARLDRETWNHHARILSHCPDEKWQLDSSHLGARLV